MYAAYFGVNPADPFSSLTDEGREKAMDYINPVSYTHLDVYKRQRIFSTIWTTLSSALRDFTNAIPFANS